MNNEHKPSLPGNCPGSAMRQFSAPADLNQPSGDTTPAPTPSQLTQWPVQLMLVPTNAPYFQNAELALTADCVPFAYADFHNDYLKGRPIAVACPKLDDLEFYIKKLTEIIKVSSLKSIELLIMEVPCCSGLVYAARLARDKSGIDIPIKVTTIGVRGENFGTQVI